MGGNSVLILFVLAVASFISTQAESKFVLCDMTQDQYRSHCLNAGICYNLVGGPEPKEGENVQTIFCSCPTEFTGRRCEERLVRPDFIPFLNLNEMPGLVEKLQKEANNIVFATSPPVARSIGTSAGRSIGLSQSSEFCSVFYICILYFNSLLYLFLCQIFDIYHILIAVSN